jgi:hypothetical protein
MRHSCSFKDSSPEQVLWFASSTFHFPLTDRARAIPILQSAAFDLPLAAAAVVRAE